MASAGRHTDAVSVEVNADRPPASDRHDRPAGQGGLRLADLTHGFSIIARMREQWLDEICWRRVGADRHAVLGGEPAEPACGFRLPDLQFGVDFGVGVRELTLLGHGGEPRARRFGSLVKLPGLSQR